MKWLGFFPTCQGEILFWSWRAFGVWATDPRDRLLVCFSIWSPAPAQAAAVLSLSRSRKGASEVTTGPPGQALPARRRMWNVTDTNTHSHKAGLGQQHDANPIKTIMHRVNQKYHAVWPLPAWGARRACCLGRGHLQRPFLPSDLNRRSASDHTQVTQLSELTRPTAAAIVGPFVSNK